MQMEAVPPRPCPRPLGGRIMMGVRGCSRRRARRPLGPRQHGPGSVGAHWATGSSPRRPWPWPSAAASAHGGRLSPGTISWRGAAPRAPRRGLARRESAEEARRATASARRRRLPLTRRRSPRAHAARGIARRRVGEPRTVAPKAAQPVGAVIDVAVGAGPLALASAVPPPRSPERAATTSPTAAAAAAAAAPRVGTLSPAATAAVAAVTASPTAIVATSSSSTSGRAVAAAAAATIAPTATASTSSAVEPL